jgi:hypothetical protein
VPLLADRLLQVIEAHQPIAEADIRGWLSDVDHIDLDVVIRQLLRASRIALIGDKYELVRAAQPQAKAVAVAIVGRPQPTAQPTRPIPPPSADEEAAAGLALKSRSDPLIPCADCKTPLPESAYRRSVFGRIKVCNVCNGKRISAALARRRAAKATDESLLRPHAPSPPPVASVMEAPAAPSVPSAQAIRPADVGISETSAALPPVGARAIALLERSRADLKAAVQELTEKLRESQQTLAEFDQAIDILKRIGPGAFRLGEHPDE